MGRRRAAAAAAGYAALLAAVGIGGGAAHAQYAWTGGGTTYNWSEAANWSGGVVPVSGPTSTLTFGGTAKTLSLNDLANPFQLSSLTFASGAGPRRIGGGALRFAGDGQIRSDSTAAQRIVNALDLGGGLILNGASDAGTITLAGATSGVGFLRIDASGPQVVLAGNNTHSGQNLLIGRAGLLSATGFGTGAVVVFGGSANLALVSPRSLTVANNFSGSPVTSVLSFTGSGAGALNLTGVLSNGAAPLSLVIDTAPPNRGAAGVVALSGGNTFSGGVTLRAGSLALGNAAALGTGALSATGSGTVFLNGGTTAAPLTLANNVSVASGATLTFAGSQLGTNSIAALTGVVSGAGGLRLSGYSSAPTLTLQGINSYTGATTVEANVGASGVSGASGTGTLVFGGANGSARNSASFTVRGGGLLTLDNSTAGANADRLNDAAPVTLAGGGLRLFTGSETIGAVTAGGGFSALTSSGALTAASLTRQDRGTLLVRGFTLGSGGNTIRVTAGLGGQLVGGGATSGADTSILPWAVGGVPGNATEGQLNGTGAYPTTFVTHDAGGFRPLNTATEFVSSLANVTAATNNVRIANTDSGVSGPTTVNSLIVLGSATTGSGTVSGSGPLTVTSGAVLLISNGTTSSPNAFISAPLAFGATEAIITASTAGTTSNAAQISGAISGTGGLTKSGSAFLILSGANTYSGDTTINAGRIQFGAASAFGGSNRIVVNGIGGSAGTLPTIAAGLRYDGASALTLAPALVVNSGYTDISTRENAGSLVLNGSVSGAGGLFLGDTTSSRIELRGTNTYQGQTIINGNVTLFGDAALGSGGAVQLSAGTDQGLTLGADWTTSRPVNVARTSVLDTGAFTATLSGAVTSAGTDNERTLAKRGTGSLILRSAAMDRVGINIEAGTLAASGALGAVGLRGGATLLVGAPGVSVPATGGDPLFAESLLWDGGGQVGMTLFSSAAATELTIAGTFQRGSGTGFAFRFTDETGAGPRPATAYTLLRAGSVSGFTASDFSVAPGSAFTNGVFSFNGNELIFTVPAAAGAVPEPSSLALALLAAAPATLVARRRRRRPR